jgi:hypothetical protein
LISEADILQQKFAALLTWEKVKRHREILGSVCCYSVLAALVILPFHVLFPAFSRGLDLPLIFLALAPLLFFKQRWRAQDSARALAKVDKTLRLDERAITAWEILAREERSRAEAFVVAQAADRLKALEPKTLFEHQLSWRDYAILPLFTLWLALLWLDVGVSVTRDNRLPTAQALAHQLREFSRQFQERAKRDGLSESVKIGQELEKTAQKGIDEKTGDEKFKNELAGLTKKVGTMGRPTAEQQSLAAAESDQSLKDLKAELEAARDLLNFPDPVKGSRELGQQWLDRLSMLPQLKRQLEQGGQTMRQEEMKSFLDKLDKQVTGELDRRTLLEAQQFLDQLMKQGQDEKGDSDVRVAGRGQQDSPADGEKAQSRSNLPGKEPGKKEDGYRSLPEFQAGAAAHVKGMIGEGNSNGLVFKGKPSAGKSEISQDEVLASYRRQAEAELNTERVPEALKETIKNYFLSLGGNDQKK